jgi:hypothetical protein
MLVGTDGVPSVNKWLLGPRTNDWISKIGLSDTVVESYGCSILFIYYLYSQLGYSMKLIVSKAGRSLEEIERVTHLSDGRTLVVSPASPCAGQDLLFGSEGIFHRK